MAWGGSFEDLEAYLRGFVNIDGGPGPYDFGGVLVLWLALLDNLRANCGDADLGDAGGYLSPEQREFLLRAVDRLREWRETELDPKMDIGNAADPGNS